MQRRQPPRIPPGPLSMQTAEALSAALRDLFALRFTAAAPLSSMDSPQKRILS